MKISQIILEAIEYDRGDPRRIEHFMKVYGYAKTIGEAEGLPEREQDILEAAAVLHDIGIHRAERLYGSSAGKYQEQEGPAVARDILTRSGADESFTEAVCAMVGRHHTYTGIDSLRLQILIEADFLVNIREDSMGEKEILSVKEKIFRTKTGSALLDNLFSEKYLPRP